MERARVRRMLRWPASPYMIVTVSTTTFSAREPDHRAITKPIETTSNRPPESTSSRVGAITPSTADGVSSREAIPSTWARNSVSVVTSKRWATKPMAPARPNTSGGSDRIAKKAASAASPVTR